METIRHAFDPRQHMLLEDFEVYHYADSRELNVSLHFHDFYECYLLLRGSLCYQAGSATFAMEPGDLLLIGPNRLHRPILDNTAAPYERVVLWLSRSYVARLSSPQTELSRCFADSRCLHRLPAARYAAVKRLLFLLLEAREHEEFGRDVLCRALVSELLVLLNRACAGRSALPPQAVRENALVAAISDYMDAHLDRPVNLDELAGRVYLSKFYMTRAFKRETGVTIHRMFMQKRMIRARELIRTGAPLTAVAFQCGFSDYSGFYKAFTDEYGVAPKMYAQVDAQRL